MTQSNLAVGYKTDEFQLHINVNDGTEFGGSIYQKRLLEFVRLVACLDFSIFFPPVLGEKDESKVSFSP